VVLEPSFLVVAADTSWPVKEGVRAVGIDAHLDPRAHEMGPRPALRDLQFQRPIRDAIVVADLALLLNAQDLVEVDAGNGGEGRALARWLNRKARIMGGQIDLAQERVGRLDGRDSRQPQFLR
jgi:hypothetical protein